MNIPNLTGKMLIEERICQHSVNTCTPVICADTRNDPGFTDHPLVKDGHVIFYAAAPLKTKDGYALGPLCVSEKTTFAPTADNIDDFLRIAALASAYLESRYSLGRIDPLTGLPNRQHLLSEMELLAKDPQADSWVLMLFDCIDIPRAYELSRYLGLTAIEKMLCSFGPLLRMRLELSDEVVLYAFATGRYAILVKKEHAKSVIRKAKTLPSTQARITGDIEITLNIFTGYVSFISNKISAHEVLRRSVSALHEAIHQSVPVRTFSLALDKKRNNNFKLLYDLSEAMKASDQLYLVYQPKIVLHSRKTVGTEALLRWEHPELGSIPPSVIVALAQKTSLMSEITNWVVAEVLRQITEWRGMGIIIPVSINFTVSDLSQSGFVDNLENKVLEAGLTTSDIRIECLETEEIVANELALQALDMLKVRGFKILLDDFGAGYSNINYLRRIPIDIIKLDRSIISKMTTDTGGADNSKKYHHNA